MAEYSSKITIEQAYLAAYEYLFRRWEDMPEWLIAEELSDMSLLPGGGSADPACKNEFIEALRTVLDPEAKSGRYSRADQQLN